MFVNINWEYSFSSSSVYWLVFLLSLHWFTLIDLSHLAPATSLFTFIYLEPLLSGKQVKAAKFGFIDKSWAKSRFFNYSSYSKFCCVFSWKSDSKTWFLDQTWALILKLCPIIVLIDTIGTSFICFSPQLN